jgi:hypothetical protein
VPTWRFSKQNTQPYSSPNALNKIVADDDVDGNGIEQFSAPGN